MSQLLDFVPILLFVAVFFSTGSDIYLATGALMIGVTAQVIIYKLIKRPIGKELQLTFWASVIFGGLTLILRDQTFIQWKPTIVNWALAATLIFGRVFANRNFIKSLMGHQLALEDPVWNTLNTGWAMGFVFAGILNLIVAYNFSMEFWVSYKLIGGFALTLCYIIITVIYLSRKGYLDEIDDRAKAEKN